MSGFGKTSNRFIRYIEQYKIISPDKLKHLYWRYSKQLHPDITRKESTDFIRLREEYEEALEWLKKIPEELRLTTGLSSVKIRKKLYAALFQYHHHNLHLIGIRQNPELRKRNQRIIDALEIYGKVYGNQFEEVFNRYHIASGVRTVIWNEEKKYKEARRMMMKGLSFFFDFQMNGNERVKRISISFIEDSLSILSMLDRTEDRVAMVMLSEWFLNEMEYPPVEDQHLKDWTVPFAPKPA